MNNPVASKELIVVDQTRIFAMRINGSTNISMKPDAVHNNIPLEYIAFSFNSFCAATPTNNK